MAVDVDLRGVLRELGLQDAQPVIEPGWGTSAQSRPRGPLPFLDPGFILIDDLPWGRTVYRRHERPWED